MTSQHPHWGPTDALLHGAPSHQEQIEQAEKNGDGSGTIFDWSKSAKETVIAPPRVPIYDESDATRQNQKRELDAEELFQIASIKEVGQELIDLIGTLPLNRELAVAKTKVEEAVMWAVKGVTK